MSHSPNADISGFRHRYLPPAVNGSARTLLMLHGTGGDESDLLEIGRALAPDAALLSPRGRVLEGSMPRFFRRSSEGVFDQEDLLRRTSELAAFLEAACEAYGRDPRRVTVVGYSNGANIGTSLLLRHPLSVASAVLFRAVVPFVPDDSPDVGAAPVLILNGSADPLIPETMTEGLSAVLRGANASVAVHWSAGGHALTEEDVTAAHRWLAGKHL